MMKIWKCLVKINFNKQKTVLIKHVQIFIIFAVSAN